MNKVIIKRLKFSTHMKLSTICGFTSGVTVGLLGFVIGMLGGNVTVNLGSNILVGSTAGIMFLIIGPLNLTIFGVIGGLLSYWPFRLFMKFKKQLDIYYLPLDAVEVEVKMAIGEIEGEESEL